MKSSELLRTDEKRRALRLASSNTALARMIGRQLACSIANKSALGMRLRFVAPPALDPVFVVYDVETGVSTRVALVWCAGCEAGVRIQAAGPSPLR